MSSKDKLEGRPLPGNERISRQTLKQGELKFPTAPDRKYSNEPTQEKDLRDSVSDVQYEEMRAALHHSL